MRTERPPPRPVVCDVAGLVHPTLGAVDGLARLQMGLRRAGRSMELHHACLDLRELIELVGLAGVLPLRGEPWGEPEQREQAGGVQEERDPREPLA